MPIPDKDIYRQIFTRGQNTDYAPENMPPDQARYILNCRTYSFGELGIITNVKGNTLVITQLPSGINATIGSCNDEANNRFFFFVYNSDGYHTIYLFNSLTNQISTVFQSRSRTYTDEDILRFSKDKLILHTDIVQGNLLYWVDGLNKARKLNISKMMDTSTTGYGISITEDYITAYKKTSLYAPQCTYITDTSRNTNNLYGNLFKFAVRYRYDDGELSNWSDWSRVPLPANQSYLGVGNITFDNNAIKVQVETGNPLVKKIELAVKVNNTQLVENEINTTDWVVCQILDKDELNIQDDTTYSWTFYNDGGYSTTDQLKIQRPYSYLPRVPLCQAFVRNAMTYTNFEEGYDAVGVNATVAISYAQLYIPDGTVNKMNNPQFIVTMTSLDKEHLRPFEVVRQNPTNHYVIGPDVKKGNVFSIYGQNGESDNYAFSYTATAADTATTIANQIKTFIRIIHRGDVVNEVIDGSGNVSWDASYLGKWRENLTRFTTYVTAVSYESLQDNGISINLIKYGSVRNYGFVYIDDDEGRDSLAYTSPTCVVRTPFITEIGSYQQPIHTITINHKPPLWAKYWRLVRTQDTTKFLWMLIQQAIDVDTTTDGHYQDLVVGSLFTYQKMHPNTVLKYDFQRGDRIRFIADENTDPATLFTVYYDTEILDYKPVSTQNINSNITVDGSAAVHTDVTVNADNIGSYIVINGYERLIVSVDSGANKYNLDENIAGDITTPATPQTYGGYDIVNRRGTIRIKKPDTITLTTNILAEVYTPQSEAISADYKLFYDFGKKYEIANWGTANAYHRGDSQDQTASLPAIVGTTNGDAYIRNREYPTNNIIPGTQVVVDKAVDPNFSDFYESDLHDTGRVYPQDIGLGKKHFGDRVRYSNNYIQDTSINGLNDFDNTSREDYNDPYGNIMLTKFKDARLYAFKQLKDTWIPVNNTLTTDNNGNTLNASTEKLLNQMQYFAFDGGIGNNPESCVLNENYFYHAMPGAGVFVRIGGEGVEPISQIFFFDKEAREILTNVEKQHLKIIGGSDRSNDEINWSILPYIVYLFNSNFNPSLWDTINDIQPDTATPIIVAQPANGTVTYDSVAQNFVLVMDTDFVGTDFFTYKFQLLDSSFTTTKKECITVLDVPNRPTGYRIRTASAVCIQSLTPPAPVNNFTVEAKYGKTINDVYNHTATGVPASLTGINLPPGGVTTAHTASVTAGTITVRTTGTSAIPGHERLALYINGVSVSTANITDGAYLYDLTNPSVVSDPANILITVETY